MSPYIKIFLQTWNSLKTGWSAKVHQTLASPELEVLSSHSNLGKKRHSHHWQLCPMLSASLQSMEQAEPAKPCTGQCPSITPLVMPLPPLKSLPLGGVKAICSWLTLHSFVCVICSYFHFMSYSKWEIKT